MTDITRVVLAVDSSQVRTATRDLDGMNKTTKATTSTVAGLGRVLLGLGAVAATGALIKTVVANTIEAEKITAQLNATLKSTGRYTPELSKSLQGYSEELQRMTTFEDDAITASQSLLLTFTKIGTDSFPRAEKAILDMSTAMKMDLQSATLQVGKALNDPLKGISALSRAGIQFTDDQKKMIKEMVKAGDAAGAQRVILKELETQFGGSAEAARDTMGGALQSLSNAFGNLLEGDSGSPGVIGVTGSINDLTDTLNSPKTKAAFEAITSGIFSIGTALAEVTPKIVDFTRWVGEELAATLGGVAADDLVRLEKEAEKIKAAITGGLTRYGDKIRIFGPDGIISYETDEELIKKLAEVYGAMAKIKAGAAEARPKIEEVSTALVENGDASGRAAETLGLTNKEIDKLKVSGSQLKDVSGEWLDKANRDLGQYLVNLQKVIDNLYPQKAAVRELMEEYDVLRAAVGRVDGVTQQALSDWIDKLKVAPDELHRSAEAIDELTEKADPFGKIWDTTIERLQGSIADMFYDMLENGKVTFDNILDLFKRMVAEMAAQKFVMSIGMGGGSSSAFAGGGGFDLSSLSSLSNFSGMLSAGISGLGATLTSVLPAAMTQGLMQSGYSVISDAALEAAVMQGGLEQGWNLAAGAGALYTAGAGILGGYAGTELGEALFGKQAESGYGAAAGAAAGAYVGSIVPVIGTAIGALIGGAIGGLIDVASGGDGRQRYAVGVSTNADWRTTEHATMQATGASGLKLTSYQKRAGEEGNAVAEAMTQAFLTTDAALTGFFRELGVTVDLAGQTLEGKASQFGEQADGFFGAAGFNGLDPADLEGAVDSFVMAWVDRANELTKSAIDLKPLIDIQREGELLADVLIRVYTQFGTINGVLESLGLNTYDVSVAGMAAADGLVALFGSLENFTTAASRYYDLFYTEQEKVSAIAEQVNSVFETLNITAPTTIDGFRDLVTEYGNMGQAGQATLATLLGIAPAFHQVATAAEAAAKASGELAAAQEEQASQALAARNATIGDIAGSILQQYEDREATIADLQGRLAKIDEEIAAVYTRMDDAVKPVADTITQVARSVDTLGVSSSQLRSIADNLLSTVDSLKLGNVSPLTNWQKLQEAQGQYNVAQSMARDGDPSQLAAAAQAYLAQAAGYYASSPAYIAIFDEVTGYLSAMGAELDQQATAVERAERIAAAQQAALQSIESTSSKAVDLTQFYGDIEKLNAERLIIEQQLANLMAVDSQSILTGQLDRLIEITTGIDSMTALLANMPTSIADGLAAVLGIAITEYRALTPTEDFFAGLPGFADGGIASGPTSGYPVMLHGTEMITPMNGGYQSAQHDNSAVVEELRAVKSELQQVKTELKTANAQRTDGNKKLGRIERASIRTVAAVPMGVNS